MNGMHITRLLLAETGTYNDLVLRPYNSQINTHSLAMFNEATSGGMHLSPGNLAGVASHILRPSTEGQGLIQIPHGFNTRRFRFMMEITMKVGSEFSSMENKQYLCGYTEHADVSHGMRLDPNMRLYFNSSVMTRSYEKMTPFGRQGVTSPTDASHILVNRIDRTYGFGQQNQNPHLMRPQDVFFSMSTAANSGQQVDDTYDLRTMMPSGRIVKSKRKHANTSSYLSNVLTTYRDTMQNHDLTADLSDMMTKAGGNTPDALITDDPFLNELQTNRYTSFMEGGSITYGELCQMMPGLDASDVVHVLMARNSSVHNAALSSRGSVEHWNGTSNETIMTTILSQSAPALMMDVMLTKVSFMATNATMDGEFHVQIVGGESFSEGLDLAPYLMNFQTRLTAEVLRPLSRNNQIQIDLQCEIDLLGDTKISISTMGGPIVPYVMPSFCDALAAPVVAPNAHTLNVLAHDFGVLGDNMHVDYSIGAVNSGFTNSPAGNSSPASFQHGTPYANSSVL